MQEYTIRQARRLQEKTQSEVASAVGVCEQTYRKIERNPEKATITQAKAIADYLGIPYDILFFDHSSN